MIQFIKRFTEWLALKQRLETLEYIPPLFNEGEIWWCHIGENLGSEISGKNNSFTRPVLILKKYDHYSFFGLPLTSKIRTGTWYLPVEFNNKKQIIILTQGRRYDYRRLQNKMGKIADIYLTIAQYAHASLHSTNNDRTYINIQ